MEKKILIDEILKLHPYKKDSLEKCSIENLKYYLNNELLRKKYNEATDYRLSKDYWKDEAKRVSS